MELIAILVLIVVPSVAVFAVRARRAGSLAPFVEAGIGLLSGAGAGLVWGVGARIAMRLVALTDGRPTEFTVGGTVFILLFGAIFGTPLGLLFAAVRRWLPCSRLRKGLTFGGVLLALLIVPFILLGAADLDGDLLDGPVLVGAGLFGALFLVYGLTVEAAMEWLERYLPGASGRSRAGRQRITLMR